MKSITVSKTVSIVACSLGLVLGACKPQPAAQPPPKPVEPAQPSLAPALRMPSTAEVPAAPARPEAPLVGMADPFKLMNTAGAKTLDLAWKALKKKDYFSARDAFHEVVAAYPDKPAARFQELRSAALAGDFAAVPALWRQLLARDFVASSQRLGGGPSAGPYAGKELAPLRKSPQWQQIQAITTEMKAAYRAGLDEGVFFVARIHPRTGTGYEDDGEPVKLNLDQEVYHLDGKTQRIRRLSDTGGRVLAIHHDGEHRQVMMLLAGAFKKSGGLPAFSQPEAVVLSLDTLEKLGPLPIAGDPATVELCFASTGEPVWATTAVGADAQAFTLDATGSSLVASDEACGRKVATTSVSPTGVQHTRPDPEGVTLSDDGLQLVGVDEDLPVRAASAIRPGSFAWSPGKKRFVYTGAVDRCALAGQLAVAATPAPNGLFVWDAERKRSTRVASAVSSYEAQWIDDDHLAYETGVDHATKLVIHDFSPGGVPVTVKIPAGAGLFGIPALDCDAELHALAQ